MFVINKTIKIEWGGVPYLGFMPVCDIEPLNAQWRRRYYSVGNFEFAISRAEYDRIILTDDDIQSDFHNIVIENTTTSEFAYCQKIEFSYDQNGEKVKLSGNFCQFTLYSTRLAKPITYSYSYGILVWLRDKVLPYTDNNILTYNVSQTLPTAKTQEQISVISGTDENGFYLGDCAYSLLAAEECDVRFNKTSFSHGSVTHDCLMLEMEIYRGEDKSDSVLFSRELQTLNSLNYSSDISGVFTYIIQQFYHSGGAGPSQANVGLDINPYGGGIQTMKYWCDIADLKDEQYQAAYDIAKTSARVESANHEPVLNMECVPNSSRYKYLEDYNLGDYVSFRDKALSLDYTPQITGVDEVYKNGHLELSLILGNYKKKRF